MQTSSLRHTGPARLTSACCLLLAVSAGCAEPTGLAASPSMRGLLSGPERAAIHDCVESVGTVAWGLPLQCARSVLGEAGTHERPRLSPGPPPGPPSEVLAVHDPSKWSLDEAWNAAPFQFCTDGDWVLYPSEAPDSAGGSQVMISCGSRYGYQMKESTGLSSSLNQGDIPVMTYARDADGRLDLNQAYSYGNNAADAVLYYAQRTSEEEAWSDAHIQGDGWDVHTTSHDYDWEFPGNYPGMFAIGPNLAGPVAHSLGVIAYPFTVTSNNFNMLAAELHGLDPAGAEEDIRFDILYEATDYHTFMHAPWRDVNGDGVTEYVLLRMPGGYLTGDGGYLWYEKTDQEFAVLDVVAQTLTPFADLADDHIPQGLLSYPGEGRFCVGVQPYDQDAPGITCFTEHIDDDDDGLLVDEDCDDRDATVGGSEERWPDADGDGYGDDASDAELLCTLEGTADNGDDCDDQDPSVNPGADEPTCVEEASAAVDQDCDGTSAPLCPLGDSQDSGDTGQPPAQGAACDGCSQQGPASPGAVALAWLGLAMLRRRSRPGRQDSGGDPEQVGRP